MPEPTENQEGQLQQIVEKLRAANNVLVTVSTDPSVDQLAACIGLTLVLNKLNKHGTAVFSGKVPSTIEFLEPEKTLEKNTDSLRDFIISLDKSKADKLRYKLEKDVVRIFITPFRTSISEKDLEFSEGDFNVDVVIALGVKNKSDLDKAITSHGRILHDATVISINTDSAKSELGSINYLAEQASSLCEIVTDITTDFGKDHLDSQIANALLTGIVAETERFGNAKSTPHAMAVSGLLMEAGASSQLVTTKLEADGGKSKPSIKDELASGLLAIEHEADEKPPEKVKEPEPQEPAKTDQTPPIYNTRPAEDTDSQTGLTSGPQIVDEPPQMGGQFTANSVPEHQRYDPSTDPLSINQKPAAFLNESPNLPQVAPVSKPPEDYDEETLQEIETEVNSPHIHANDDAPPPVDYARDAVERAVDASSDYRPEPIQSLNAQPFDLGTQQPTAPPQENNGPPPVEGPDEKPLGPPPPVPPPMMPPTP